MKFLIIPALVSALLIAPSLAVCAAVPKPRCDARHDGAFWPEQANQDSNAARLLFQNGELEMCTLQVWKYRWEQLSVNVRGLTLAKRSKLSDEQTRKDENIDPATADPKAPAKP